MASIPGSALGHRDSADPRMSGANLNYFVYLCNNMIERITQREIEINAGDLQDILLKHNDKQISLTKVKFWEVAATKRKDHLGSTDRFELYRNYKGKFWCEDRNFRYIENEIVGNNAAFDIKFSQAVIGRYELTFSQFSECRISGCGLPGEACGFVVQKVVPIN